MPLFFYTHPKTGNTNNKKLAITLTLRGLITQLECYKQNWYNQIDEMRLSDQLSIQIKNLILQQDLQYGDRLPSERKLAALFNVSRPAIREAIHSLTGQGVLVTKRGGGSYLQTEISSSDDLSLTSISDFILVDKNYQYDVLEARQAIERSTAWHAALRRTEQDKAKIQRCFDAIHEQQTRGDSQQAAIADAEFHLAIAEASHNIVFVQIMRGLFNVLLTNVTKNRQTIFNNPDPHTYDALSQQHYALLEAILNSDPEQAQTAATHHLDFINQASREWEEDQARQHRATRLSR